MFLALVMAGTLIGAILFPHLPARIPVQWNAGEVIRTAPRGMIFGYPLSMLFIRFVLCGRIRTLSCLYLGGRGERIAPYAINGSCFLMLCLEAFTILFLFGAASSVEAAIAFAGAFGMVMLLLTLRGFGAKNEE